MNKIANIYLIGLLILPLAFLGLNSQVVSAGDGNFPTPDKDGNYFFRIEASQWEFIAFDLVEIQEVFGTTDFEVLDRNEVEEYEMKGKIGEYDKADLNFQPGAEVTLDIYTRDVQHGFKISEVNLAVATNRPTPGDLFGIGETRTFIVPDQDITVSAFCHIFCGLGHPDMKLKLVFGKGSFEFGPIVFWSAIGVNVLILALVFRSIFTKVKP